MRFVQGATAVCAATAFKAATVEYQATSACGAGSCGVRTREANVAALTAFAATAAKQGVCVRRRSYARAKS
jgi:hypothetical protein